MMPRLTGRARINAAILLTSGLAWMMLLVDTGSIISTGYCSAPDAGAAVDTLRTLLAFNPVSSLIAGWGLMLAAMMAPTLIAPVHYIRERSFRRRRGRSIALFVAGYAAIWMAAGSVAIAAMLAVNVVAPGSYLPAVAVAIVALAWQCSPAKQRCLNRGHNHRALAAFGAAADLDALRFGVQHGLWCVGSCWALMLLPMLLPHGHHAAMAVATFVMTSERLEQPRAPGWRLRVPGKLARIAVAQTRMRWVGVR